MSRGFELKYEKSARKCLDFKYIGYDDKDIEYYDLAWQTDSDASDYELNRVRGAKYLQINPKDDIDEPCDVNLYFAEEMWRLTILNGLLLAGITLLICWLTCGKIKSRIKIYFHKDDQHNRVDDVERGSLANVPSEP